MTVIWLCNFPRMEVVAVIPTFFLLCLVLLDAIKSGVQNAKLLLEVFGVLKYLGHRDQFCQLQFVHLSYRFCCEHSRDFAHETTLHDEIDNMLSEGATRNLW